LWGKSVTVVAFLERRKKAILTKSSLNEKRVLINISSSIIIMPRNRNRKRKAAHEPGNRNHIYTPNKKDASDSTPDQIQADPILYLQIPPTHQCQPHYASATLLGLADDDLIDDLKTLCKREDLVGLVAKSCPDLMATDATLFRKLLETGDKTFLMMLSRSPLISNVLWDLDLAMLAIQKSSVYLARVGKSCPHLLSEATVFRQLLEQNETSILKLLSQSTLFSQHVAWDLDLAMLAVDQAPTFYQNLPLAIKTNNTVLALATMIPSDENAAAEGESLIHIVNDVQRHCPAIFSNDDDSHTALAKVLDSNNEELVSAILVTFGDQIVWDADLVEIALDSFPNSYSFLPAEFRNDNVDAQQVMALLLKPNVTDVKVDDAIAAFPGFFADQDAMKQLFEKSDNNVVERVVEKMSRKLPWDKDLMRLAAEMCDNGEYHQENPSMADEEMERMYKGNKKCKHHLPLGMLVSRHMADAVDKWPDFLNHCPCALAHDESILKEALYFVGLMVQRSGLLQELTSWLQGIVRPIKKEFQNRQSFQTLLKCITVADQGQGTLELLRGDGDTSIALKRHIAEFLGAPIVKQTATLKRDALKLVYCLLTLPAEFRNEMDSPSEVLNYKSSFRGDDTFYCKWCCEALAALNDKYKGDEGDSDKDDEADSDEEEEVDSD
jgi:hypothetical protein